MKRKLPNVFTREQVIKFFDNVEETSVAMGCFVAFLLGLRIGEVCSLVWDNVNLSERKIKVVNGKSGDGYVDIPAEAIPIFQKWKYLADSKYFIPFNNEKHQSRLSHLTGGHHRALKKAGLLIPYKTRDDGKVVNRLTFHSWRHTHGTLLWELTGDIFLVKERLRHKDIQATQVYMHISNPQLKKTIDRVFSRREPKQEIKQQQAKPTQQFTQSPLGILQLKLINNEITADEYKEKLGLLNQFDNVSYIG